MGPGGVLVRLDRLLGDVHAALYRRAAGHDAAIAAYRYRALGSLYESGAGGSRYPGPGRDLPGHAVDCQHQAPRELARSDGRSLGRTPPGMGDRLTRSLFQL